jgi:phospholipid/cholesterol/gamma-HCH transport system substrate-binding protein
VVRTAVKLGLFVAVCTGLTLWLAFTIGNVHPFRHTYRLTATFDDVTGLLPDDNVKVAGVPVGKVRSVKVVAGRAVVSFEVADDVRVPTDSTAAIRWRNLLGQRYLYIYPGRASTVLRPGQSIARTVPVVDLGELFNRLGPIVKAIDPAEVNELLDAVVAGLDGNEEKLRQAIADLATLGRVLAERDQAIGRLVANLDTLAAAVDRRDAQIRQMLDNLVLVAQTFSENADVLETAVDELADYSGHLGTLLAANRAEIDSAVANLARLTDLVRTKLPVLDRTLAGLDEAARRLFTASQYGEWLNQTIPCGRAGYPQGVSADTCVAGAGSTGGARAFTELIGGAAR